MLWEPGQSQIKHHWAQDLLSYSNHPFPHPAHVGGMGRAEDPRTSLFHKKPFHFSFIQVEGEGMFSSLHAPTKFIPRSKCICFIGPRMAMKHLKVFMNQDVSIFSIISIWTTLKVKQVNNTAHLLLFVSPSVTSRNGKRTINIGPHIQYVKGGSVLTLSMGRLAIFCTSVRPHNFRSANHTHKGMGTSEFFGSHNQKPAIRMASSGKCLPWCWDCFW